MNKEELENKISDSIWKYIKESVYNPINDFSHNCVIESMQLYIWHYIGNFHIDIKPHSRIKLNKYNL